MQRFEIQPVLDSTLPDVAGFLQRWRGNQDEGFLHHAAREDSLSIERRLRWLLLENQVARDGSHGFCVRDQMGVIRGLTLCFSGAFLAADQRMLGLCSGSFFVEPQARMLGFYLFRRYLSSPGYSFFFATTCNATSAALWGKLGGSAVPNSEMEYILPLRLETLLPALVTGRVASEIARVFGQCTSPLLRHLERRPAELTMEPCRDWQKLSELFRRHRSTDWITTDRSAEFLQWRYGQNPLQHPCDVHLFRDKRGNEGWFSLSHMMRGRQGQIRGSVLLDAIWPREKMSFRDIFPLIMQLVSTKADAIFLRPRLGLDYGECSRWIIRRRLEAPQVFAITRKGDPRLAVGSLDLVFADGDSARPI
jgi:hypothetical protein